MSRRDTIIIAVLINACLLVVLFATSLGPKDKPKHVSVQSATPPVKKIHFEDIDKSQIQATKQLEQSVALQTIIKPPVAKEPVHQPPPIIKSAPVVKAQKYTEVTVKSGDYLERIGRENNVSVPEIMSLNDLKTTQLRIGQVLRIPANNHSGAEQPKKPTKQYMVKTGDTAWKIANENKMQLDDLLKINHLDKESSRHLKPGDMLFIR